MPSLNKCNCQVHHACIRQQSGEMPRICQVRNARFSTVACSSGRIITQPIIHLLAEYCRMSHRGRGHCRLRPLPRTLENCLSSTSSSPSLLILLVILSSSSRTTDALGWVSWAVQRRPLYRAAVLDLKN